MGLQKFDISGQAKVRNEKLRFKGRIRPITRKGITFREPPLRTVRAPKLREPVSTKKVFIFDIHRNLKEYGGSVPLADIVELKKKGADVIFWSDVTDLRKTERWRKLAREAGVDSVKIPYRVGARVKGIAKLAKRRQIVFVDDEEDRNRERIEKLGGTYVTGKEFKVSLALKGEEA